MERAFFVAFETFDRLRPETAEQATQLWRENYMSLVMNGMDDASIRRGFGLDYEDLVEGTQGESGSYLAVHQLSLRLVDLRILAQQRIHTHNVDERLKRWAHLVEPNGYIDVTALAIVHLINHIKASKVADVQIGEYVRMAQEKAPLVLLGDTQEKRYDAYASALVPFQARMGNLDLHKFPGKKK